MGSDIGSGPARSVVYVRYSLDKNFSNAFSLFQPKSKSYGPYT